MNISVIIPLYNKGILIKRAINSILKQTIHGCLEIVVVDDGSTDDSANYVESNTASNVRLVSKPNGGVSSARNIGIVEAKYDWLLFLDADDEMLPGSLKCFEELQQRYTSVRVFVGGIYNRMFQPKKIVNHQTVNPFFFLWLNRFYPRPGAILLNKSVIEQYGTFDVRQSFYEDFDFGFRMLKCGRIVYTNFPVVSYNQDESGLSSSKHPIEKEFAFYIPEIFNADPSFWERALLFENLEMQIYWWSQNHNISNEMFYKKMRDTHFGCVYRILHWIRQKLIRKNII